MKMPHTATHRGKRVRIGLKDGTVIVDQFIDRRDKYVYLRSYGRLAKALIRSMSDLKPSNKRPDSSLMQYGEGM